MAKNDVVLLDSLVDKAKLRLGQGYDDSEVFELFCFEQLLKDYDPSYEEIESGWTDGTNDGGIDGFFVFVDGRLATEDVVGSAPRKNPKVQLLLFTVRHGDSFQQEPLNALCGALPELFDLRKSDAELAYPFATEVLAQRRLFREVFVRLADRHPSLEITVLYCSRGDTSILPDNLTTRADQLGAMIRDLFSEATTAVKFRGAAELLELARRQPTYSLRLRFTESFISREGHNYVALSRLPDYSSFVTDEQGQLRRYLFESNVRDYLGEVRINQDIRRTLEDTAQPNEEDFWWLNNGVTILATQATVVGKEISLEDVQIVNGLQTTETIYRYFQSGGRQDDDRAVLLKIILASDDNIRGRIIKATNYQNTVDLASLRGLDKIQRDIEHYLWDNDWFYDRRKNYYKNQGKPADRIVSMPYLAAAVRAVALADPARSPRQRSRSLRDDEVYGEVFDPKWDLVVYLASLEITRSVETVIHRRRTVFDTPPIALVHYVAFAYACLQLGATSYKPDDVGELAARPPNEREVLQICQDLKNAAALADYKGRSVRGVPLNKDFIRRFLSEKGA